MARKDTERRNACDRAAGIAAFLGSMIVAVIPARAALVNYWTFDGDMSDTAGSHPGNNSTSGTDMEEYPAQPGAPSPTYVQGPVADTTALQTVGGAAWGNVAITRSEFDGTADVAFTSSSTLAFWVKLPTTTSEFFTDGDRFDHVKIISWGNGSVDVQTSNIPGDTTVNVTVPPGEWHFLTVVCDDMRDTRKVYVDGVLRGTGVYLETGTPVHKYICLGVPDKSTYWGTVAYARMSVWDHAMDDAEVQCLYEHGGDVVFPCGSPGGTVIIVR